MLLKFSALALASCCYALNIKIGEENISFRSDGVIIADKVSFGRSKRQKLFQPLTAPMLNAGYNAFFIEAYGNGLGTSKKFQPNRYVCSGDEWALHSFSEDQNTSRNPDDMPYWSQSKGKVQLCDQNDKCYSNVDQFSEVWTFGKIKQIDGKGKNLCAETNFYISKKLYNKVKNLIDAVEPEDRLILKKDAKRENGKNPKREDDHSDVALRAFLVANKPRRRGVFAPLTPELLNGGYWAVLKDLYGREAGIKGNGEYESESGLICLGNGWAIRSIFDAHSGDEADRVDFYKFPTFTSRFADKGFRLCRDMSDPNNCEEGDRNLRDKLRFAKHPTLCQENHLWVAKSYMRNEGRDIKPVALDEDVKSTKRAN